MGKTHVWEKDPIRPGDVLKLVDKLTPDERMAVEKLRALGNTGVLEKRAAILGKVAAAAQNQYEAAALMDQNPGVIEMPEPYVRPTYQLAQLALLVLILGAVAMLALKAPHPAPVAEAQTASPPAAEVVKAKEPTRKGGAR
jgi:hypothetical protein